MTNQPEIVHRSAIISPCTNHRFVLKREWQYNNVYQEIKPGRITFCMLNPLIADSEIDDHTVKKCVGFAHRMGYQRLSVVNLFTFRSTDPDALKKQPHEALNLEESHVHLLKQAITTSLFICAWGPPGRLHGRDKAVFDILAQLGVDLYCLALTKDGSPGHPLMLGYDNANKIQKYCWKKPTAKL